MGKTVEQLLNEISCRELREWMAYYELEPFGEESEFWRAGLISSTIANVNRKKGTKAFEPKDFMPTIKHQTTEDHAEIMEHIAQAFGAKRIKRES